MSEINAGPIKYDILFIIMIIVKKVNFEITFNIKMMYRKDTHKSSAKANILICILPSGSILDAVKYNNKKSIRNYKINKHFFSNPPFSVERPKNR